MRHVANVVIIYHNKGFRPYFLIYFKISSNEGRSTFRIAH